jgi:hypothetical protein
MLNMTFESSRTFSVPETFPTEEESLFYNRSVLLVIFLLSARQISLLINTVTVSMSDYLTIRIHLTSKLSSTKVALNKYTGSLFHCAKNRRIGHARSESD